MGNDWLEFSMSHLVSFVNQNPNISFLNQVMLHWKPDELVFKFDQAKICLIFEEFGSIFGEKDFSQVYIPPRFDPLASSISKLLKVSLK